MTDKTTPEFKLPENIAALAKKIEKNLKIGEGNVITFEKDFFESHLPEDLKLSDVRKVDEYRDSLFSAVAYAVGNEANGYFKKNKNADAVTASYNAGRATYDLRFDREKTSPGFNGSEPKTNYNVMSAKVTSHGGVPSKGNLKKIRTEMMRLGAAGLAK